MIGVKHTTPPSVGQVPMTDDVPTGSATVSGDVSMMSAEDSGYVDVHGSSGNVRL